MQAGPIEDLFCPMWLLDDGKLTIFIELSSIQEHKRKDVTIEKLEEYDEED